MTQGKLKFYKRLELLTGHYSRPSKVEIILEQRYVAFLSPSKICENLIKIFLLYVVT